MGPRNARPGGGSLPAHDDLARAPAAHPPATETKFGAGTYTLFDGYEAIVGSLDSDLAHLTGSIGGYAGTLSLADGGRDIVINVVPEPGALTLLLGSAALLGWRRRR